MKKIIIFVLLLFAALGAFFIYGDIANKPASVQFDSGWTIKEYGERNDIKPGTIKKQLQDSFGIQQELYGSTRLNELDISDDQLREALNRSKTWALPRFFLFKIIIWAFGLWLIFRYVLTARNKKRIDTIRAIIMVFVFLALGFLTGPSPNPMESTVQLVKYLAGIETKYQYAALIFVIFALFSIVGPKFFCSWGCPLGALQESIFNIPFLKNKKLKIPFVWSMTVRVILFVVFLLGLLVFADYFHGRSIFHYVSYFNIFAPSGLSATALYALPLLLILSFFIFRPFCHWICPFGLISWVLEKVSISRIRVERDRCSDCNLCVKACPTDAMRGILDNQKKVFQADCWSCGKCISSCAKDAVVFK